MYMLVDVHKLSIIWLCLASASSARRWKNVGQHQNTERAKSQLLLKVLEHAAAGDVKIRVRHESPSGPLRISSRYLLDLNTAAAFNYVRPQVWLCKSSPILDSSQLLGLDTPRRFRRKCNSVMCALTENREGARSEDIPEIVTKTIEYTAQSGRKSEKYVVKVQPASQLTAGFPPLLCIPPVGVGISREFFDPLHREWAALRAPSELHTPELLGCGEATPKPRRFYTPELWADQLLDYINSTVKQPVIVVSQGGLLPVTLEMWRKGGQAAIAGVSFVSPPPLRFFAPSAESEQGVRTRFRDSKKKPAGRGRQRFFWLLSQSTVGGLFFRYLRAGKGQPRIRSFSERNLFASAEKVDDEWMQMCYKGSRDSRSRFATLAYLCGTVPGGSWRDDRSYLLDSLDVPTQVLRGDSVEGAAQRLASFVERVPRPSCCELIPDGRAVLPYENAAVTAKLLALFLDKEFKDASV